MFLNNYQKGNYSECLLSKRFHGDNIPLLVSSLFLRSYGLGQIDLSYFIRINGEVEIHIHEIKSSGRFSLSQRRRIEKSAKFISNIFGLSSQIFCSYVK